ncbi:hypothetical protein AgCh_017529 [Apium graveolens]
MITPGGGAAPSTASWILLRCRGVAVVGILQNNTGRGVGVPRHLRRETIGSGSGGHLAGVDALHLFPSRAWANVSRVGVYQGSAWGTELVRSGGVRDYSLQELHGVMSLGVGIPGAASDVLSGSLIAKKEILVEMNFFLDEINLAMEKLGIHQYSVAI